MSTPEGSPSADILIAKMHREWREFTSLYPQYIMQEPHGIMSEGFANSIMQGPQIGKEKTLELYCDQGRHTSDIVRLDNGTYKILCIYCGASWNIGER